MSCYGCGTGFSAFKKEKGCKNCGFAFCSHCLHQKHAVPRLNNEKHKVCNKCYNILTGKVKPKEDNPARYSPPENFKKRVAALHEREAKGQGHVSQGSSKGHGGVQAGKSQYRGMSAADIELQKRLDKLKEKSPEEAAKPQFTTRELDDRLARLKGMDPSRYNNTNIPHPHLTPKRRTEQEEIDELMDEIGEEVDLDAARPDPAKELSDRLNQLRQGPQTKGTQDTNSGENNLNKPSNRDSDSFSHNITNTFTNKNTSKDTGSTPSDSSSASSNKPTNEGGDEMSAEEMGRILNEAAQELEEDAQRALRGLEKDKQIMKRLQEVKQRRKESQSDINKDEEEKSDSENEETDDMLAERVIQSALEENKLDEAAAKDGINVDGLRTDAANASKPDTGGDLDEWDDPDELPYCIICNEDATIRCFGCDRDLYCNTCFRDGHKELGLTDHASIKYTTPKEKT